MNIEVKKIWVEALRSGKYKQGRRKLHVVDAPCGEHTYCCLGVLCELAEKSGICSMSINEGTYGYDGATTLLPNSVMEWAGLNYAGGELNKDGEFTSLVKLNDFKEMDFVSIADIIEKYL